MVPPKCYLNNIIENIMFPLKHICIQFLVHRTEVSAGFPGGHREDLPFFPGDAAQAVIQTLVMSNLDNSNSLLTRGSASATRPQQLIQEPDSHLALLKLSQRWLPVVCCRPSGQ